MLRNQITITIRPLDNGYEVSCVNPNEASQVDNAKNPANQQNLVALDLPGASMLAAKFLAGVTDPATTPSWLPVPTNPGQPAAQPPRVTATPA